MTLHTYNLCICVFQFTTPVRTRIAVTTARASSIAVPLMGTHAPVHTSSPASIASVSIFYITGHTDLPRIKTTVIFSLFKFTSICFSLRGMLKNKTQSVLDLVSYS